MLVKIKNLIVKCGESEKRHADLRLEQQTNKQKIQEAKSVQ